jgi:ribonucleoside-diphosphate reductase alpha chain
MEKIKMLNFSDHALSLLTSYYMTDGETDPKESLKRASLAYCGGDLELADRIYQYAVNGWFMFSSPILSNARLNGDKKAGLPISCFLSFVDDSLEGLIDHSNELRWMSVLGGGVGGHWSSVRTVSDKSPGPIPFIKTIDSDVEAYRQGKTRKGSYACYLDVSHPDIIEFLNIRVPTGGDTNRKCFNLNNAVNLSDAFMQAVLDDADWNLVDPHNKQVKETVKARELWQRILEVRFRTGEPYFFFSDTANKHLPQSLKDKGLKIHGSNLCMAGSDRVVTSRGYLTAQELYEQGGELEVFDGVAMQKSTAMQLIEKDVPTYKITLKNGLSHTVTGYHKIKTDNGETPCQDLKVGDRVHIQSNKGLFGTTSMEDEAFLLGLYQADGTQYKDIIMLDLWEDDFDLVNEVEGRFARVHHKYGCDTYESTNQHGVVCTRGREPAKFTTCTVNQSTVAKKRLASKTLKKALDFTKGQVPYWIWESDEATQWQYVRGLFYADGCVSLGSSRGEPIYLSISNVNKDFLNDLHLLLRNLGLPFALHLQREAGYANLPDGKGGYKDYPTQTCYRLVCGSKNACLLFEEKTGFLTRRGVSIENRKWRDNSRKVSEIVSIEYAGHQDVYCLTVESEAHCFVANGFITLNCNEIFLATDKDRSAVCCLSSLNIEYFDEWKDTTIIEDCITFLDNVLQYFIDNAPKQLHKAIYSAMHERSLGLGAMGFHSYLQRKNIAFESAIAKSVNMKIFKTIKERAVKQTEELAKTRGEYLDGVGTGRRNSHLLAIAPNANSAIILDTSPSIEPWKSNAFTHRTRAGSFLTKNKYLDKILVEKNLPKEEYDSIWQSIILNQGSVQHLDCLTDYQKDVFKTAFELDQMWLIEHGADRQVHICQGQSLNLFFPSGSDKAYVNAVHIMAWKKGLKGLYYLRTNTGVVAEKVSTKIERKALKDYDECIACQG